MSAPATETLTLRIPKRLKRQAAALAESRGMTFTALVREALEDVLQPAATGRIIENQGIKPEFHDFIQRLRTKRDPDPVIILVEDPKGQRYFFEGFIDLSLTNESILAVKRLHGRKDWIIPRRDVVGWHEGTRRDLNELAMSLQELGWAARTEYEWSAVAER